MNKFIEFLKRFYGAYQLANSSFVDDLEKENERLRCLMKESFPEKDTIHFIVDVYHQLSEQVEGGTIRIITEMLAKQFIETGATNYIEVVFKPKYFLPDENLIMTLQKASGLTPHQRCLKLEKELAEEREWKNW